NFLSNPTSLIDHLNWQLTMSHHSPDLQDAIEMIIGNLNEDGYLTASLEEMIAQGAKVTSEQLEQALRIVQDCDPAGVAARDLRECLLIQLRHLAAENSIAAEIVKSHLNQLQNKQYKEIARALGK